MTKYVLFDLDGVIADTERLKGEAFAKACRFYGGKVTANFYPAVIGKPGDEVIRSFIKASGAKVDETKCMSSFKKIYQQLLKQEVQAVPGAGELLKVLKDLDWKIGLVSSSSHEALNFIVDRLGFRDYFSVIVSAKDVSRHKPAPDLYIHAMKLMGVRPEDGVAVEDTESGVSAAHSAGLRVIALKHKLNRRHDFSVASITIGSLRPTEKLVHIFDEL